MKKYLFVIFTIFSFTLFSCVSSGPQVENGSQQLPCEETDSYVGETVTCVVTVGNSCTEVIGSNDGSIYCTIPDWNNPRFLLLIKGKDKQDYYGKCLLVRGFVHYTSMVNEDGSTSQPMLEINAGSNVSFCQ